MASTAEQGEYKHQSHTQQIPPPLTLQHRAPSIVHQQTHPTSPRQSQPGQHPGAYNSPHASSHGVPIHHQSPYSQGVPQTLNGAPPSDGPYYTNPSPYDTPASGQYSSSEGPDLMAAAQMQRPYAAPAYHTPQSNSPASIHSPQSHDPHRANLYHQQAPHLPQAMYGYSQYQSMNQVHPSPYAQHPNQHQQHAGMTSQPLNMLPHQQNQPQQLQHQVPPGQNPGMTNSPRPKLEPSVLSRPLDSAGLQRPPSGPMSAGHGPPNGAPGVVNGIPPGQPGGSGVNPNAAPGPIPATTPLVVRQDNNGVQWIAFEYSRDRVKMEYTIRCDVESVNVEGLHPDFKTENCVYPRACCNKDQYRGNRLNYETECNTVGWALAELNPCLRGKRGLIQRAVDSWRNSNQDPRLRSRRVRRMAKISNRKQVAASHPSHMAGPSGPPGSAGLPNTNPMAVQGQRPSSNSMGMGGAHLHHHHAHPDGSAADGPDDVSVNSDYDAQRQQSVKAANGLPNGDVRQGQVFHGYPSYPGNHHMGPAMPPSLHTGMDSINGQASSNINAVAASAPKTEEQERNTALFGDLPESKRRKFILVDDPDRNTRVRVRVVLDSVNMDALPDSYRKANSVYPRSYFPVQMQSPPKSARGSRFFEEHDPEGGEPDDQQATRGRAVVRVPIVEGGEGEVTVPKIAKGKQNREATLNDLGYRMSWNQSKVFSDRTMMLQRALDTYRNKMRSTMESGGQEISIVPPHFQTRVGKKTWTERRKRGKRGATP